VYFLEGSHLSSPTLNNCCVNVHRIICSRPMLCRIRVQ